MPGPAAPLVIIGRVAHGAYRSYSTYEATQTIKEAAKLASEIVERKNLVKQLLHTTIESLREEIKLNSETLARIGTSGNSTVHRRGNEGTTYKEYIERKIPFRPAISQVCEFALKAPIKVTRRLRNKVPGDVVETTIDIALKQTTASLIFEVIDEALDWQCHLKAEPSYDALSKKALTGVPATRPKRVSETFPFWPRLKNSLAPDLVIVEYRQQPFEINNILAAVEIKFPKDWVKSSQIAAYSELVGRNEKISLLRVPEDCITSNRNTGDTTSTKKSIQKKKS